MADKEDAATIAEMRRLAADRFMRLSEAEEKLARYLLERKDKK